MQSFRADSTERMALFKELQADIFSVTANHFAASPGEQTNLHLHPDRWHITYTVRGKGACLAGGRKYNLRPGLVHVVYPNEIHKYRADVKTPYTIYFLHINCDGPVAEIFPRAIAARRLSRNTLRIFGQLTRLCHSVPPKRCSLRKHALLGVLLADLLELDEAPEPRGQIAARSRSEQAGFKDILEQLRMPPFRYPGINRMAAQLNMSRRSFTAYFRKLAGMSARAYYLQYRMSHARMLLAAGELRVKEVARRCGYSNSQNFIRSYKKYGVSK
ncbi:MAG: AraC family transcriptional regulator [Kiritimatiellae bacterium]|jgi:AraC-like DNA-binding protein/quercetin dioxygenase-like cupin family protein|nr:AraC family transcriptional regulator [Kiritimatiellia bacterium]